MSCEQCPFRLWPVLCHAEATRHKRYCEHIANGDPMFTAIVEAATLGTKLIPPKPPPTSFIPDATAIKMELCDFRRSTCGCLSKPAECLAGGFPAIVTLDDCRACTI